jgi:spoIIIJ-associated protein
MKDEYEGKDLEEAIARASADLGIPEEELHYEVVEQGRKGLLGLGTKEFRIRVMRPVEHLTDHEILVGEEPAGARAEPVEPVADAAAESARETSPSEAPARRPRRKRSRSRRSGRSRKGSPTGNAREAEDAAFEEADETPVEPLTGQALEVQQCLEKILELAGLQIEVRPARADSGVALRLGGADRKSLKRRNAELLQALQLVLNRMARRAWPGVGRIQLTANGDDKRRDSKLVELTRGAAKQVAKTGRTRKLRPMNAYERRLVHLTIREFTGLTSSSDGDGAVKRVRISKVKNTLNV